MGQNVINGGKDGTAAKAVLVMEPAFLPSAFRSGCGGIVRKACGDIYVIPDVYDSYMRTMDIENLKLLNKNAKRAKLANSRERCQTFARQHPGFTEADAFAVLFSLDTGARVLVDDPGKAAAYKECGADVLRVTGLMPHLFSFYHQVQEGGEKK